MRDRASTEDLITPCVSLLNSLSFHKVREDWVDSIWDGQFTETQVRYSTMLSCVMYLNLECLGAAS